MSSAGPCRLMLIEDNPADQLLIREAIRFRGLPVEVVWLSDLPQALAALNDERNPLPSAILLDLTLPRGDGITVIHLLHSSPRLSAIPLAILSTSCSPRELEQVKSLGVLHCVRKPSSLDEFIGSVGDTIAELLRETSPSGCAGRAGS